MKTSKPININGSEKYLMDFVGRYMDADTFQDKQFNLRVAVKQSITSLDLTTKHILVSNFGDSDTIAYEVTLVRDGDNIIVRMAYKTFNFILYRQGIFYEQYESEFGLPFYVKTTSSPMIDVEKIMTNFKIELLNAAYKSDFNSVTNQKRIYGLGQGAATSGTAAQAPQTPLSKEEAERLGPKKVIGGWSVADFIGTEKIISQLIGSINKLLVAV